MKTAISTIFLLTFGLSFLQAQVERYAFGDSIFVWASSLNMRESPNAGAKIVGKAPYGSAVVIVDDSIGKAAYKYKAIESKTLENGGKSEPFYLNGYWVKANFDGTVGYVFDGYLSKIKPLVGGSDARTRVETWAKQILKLKSSKYEQGDNAWTEYFDDSPKITIRIGHDEKTAFTQINLGNRALHEGIMLALQIFKAEYLVSIEKSVYEFQSADDTSGDCQIFVSLKKNELAIVLSCHC